MTVLATIGYEQSSLEDFIATLEAAKVTTLIDVREVPVSRRKGFSKNILRNALADKGIEYVHLVGLGDPKAGRIAAREGRFEEFLEIYSTHLKSDRAQTDLQRAVEIIRPGGSCLMCYERSPIDCHRKLVADALSDKVDLAIKHLGIREGIARNGGGKRSRTRIGTREGAAACG